MCISIEWKAVQWRALVHVIQCCRLLWITDFRSTLRLVQRNGWSPLHLSLQVEALSPASFPISTDTFVPRLNITVLTHISPNLNECSA